MKERDNYDLHLWDGLTQGFINKDEYLELMNLADKSQFHFLISN
jgi:hypothetical protein